MTSLTLPGASASATYTHDAARERTGVTLPNGAVTAYAYDPAGRLASVATTLASGVIASTYGRDETGRVTSENAERFSYDDAGRLREWYDPSADATTTYSFDAASNLTGVSVAGTPVATYTVDAADRITNAGFIYDAAGNLTSDGTRDFYYDAACRLTTVQDASTEATVATYTYDAMNRRVSATEGSATVFFHYDGASSRVIAETDETGVTIATYAYAYDDRGQLHAMSRGGATYFYHLDARGDVVNTYRYDPWGKLIGSEETVENPYRYASYRADAATGLYYCWNRYYAPELGRFLTRDIYPGEISDPVTMNPYLYCGGDPVNRVDPSGMWTAVAVVGLLGGFGLAVAWAAGDTFYGPANATIDAHIAEAEAWRKQGDALMQSCDSGEQEQGWKMVLNANDTIQDLGFMKAGTVTWWIEDMFSGYYAPPIPGVNWEGSR
ncbi:MAG: RHS repeat-associated core domain-containing protein [Coriobacteriia bacterium]